MWTAVRGGNEGKVFLGVCFAVTEVAFIVIIGFFAHRDAKYEGEGCDICNNESWAHIRRCRASTRGICIPILRAGTN